MFSTVTIYRRIFAYYRPYLPTTLGAATLSLVAIACGIARGWPFAFIVDHILPAARGEGKVPLIFGRDFSAWSPESLIGALCLVIVGLHLIAGVVNMISTMIFIRVGLQALLRLRTEIYAALHGLPLKFHSDHRSTDSSFRVAYDSQSIQTFYAKATFLYSTAFSLIGTFLTMWTLDRQLTLMSLVVIPLMIGTIFFYARKIRAQSTAIAEQESAVLTQAQEGLGAIKMVQAFGREDHEIEQFRTRARGSLEAHLRQTGTSMFSALVVSTLIALSTAALYWLGSHHVLGGQLKLGELMWMATLLAALYGPLEALTHLVWAVEGAAASATRCFEVLDRENDLPDRPDARVLTAARGELAFENVAFGYEKDRDIFRNVNLTIAPGQTVAFVGGTGAGKSTLLALVPRFYDPTAGRVMLDGTDLRDVTKKSLREQMSIVLQDTLLFSTTVRENIAYGRADATDEEIIAAAKRAQAHDFIMAMPEGYRSQVGERGGRLSVGQRQRIGIARAFLKNAPVLILDEPTSALDPTTESAIMQTIEELMHGRTTLIITHRIATVHSVDKIVVLGPGGVIESGTGKELLTLGGKYAELYTAAHAAPE